MLKNYINIGGLALSILLLTACSNNGKTNHIFGSSTHHNDDSHIESLIIPGIEFVDFHKEKPKGSNTHHDDSNVIITSLFIMSKEESLLKKPILGSNTHHQ